METTITGRHAEISDKLRTRAMTVGERLGKLALHPMEMAVVFDSDGADRTAELRLHARRGEVLIARGKGADHRSALDRAQEKLRRQLERSDPRRAAMSQSKNPL
jgi:ribosomal subunit interface protein